MGLLDWIFGALVTIIIVVFLLFLVSIGLIIYNSLEDKNKESHLKRVKQDKDKDEW